MILAFGEASGLGASAGLYGAIIVGFFAAIFGGTPGMVSGPTGPTTVVVASIVAIHLKTPAVVFLIISLAGLFQILLGMAQAGSLIKLVTRPVISGFMTGIGCMVIILQLNPLLGMPSQGNVIDTVKSLIALSSVNTQCIILASATLLIILFTPNRIGKAIPLSLIALFICSAICILLRFDVPLIQTIPPGLPETKIAFIEMQALLYILPLAIGLALVASIDTLMTSLIVDNMLNTKHGPNKELIGQGIANIISGVFGGMACASSTLKTVASIKAGGRTKLSGVVYSLVLLLILYVLSFAEHMIPLSVLSGVLIKVGIDVIDWKFIRNIFILPKSDIIIMLTVLSITLVSNLVAAVVAGVVLQKIFNRFAGFFNKNNNPEPN